MIQGVDNMFDDSWDDELRKLVDNKNWKQVLNFGKSLPIEQKSRLLWAWPSVDNLNYLNVLLNELNIKELLSIGCGSGLLEWIISESTGLTVNGLEYDMSWWNSEYCPKPFIRLNFTVMPVTPNFLLECSDVKNWNFALLFCYFNNHKAFLDYVKAYKGNYILIIGPGHGQGTYTDPMPFEPNFDPEYQWNIVSCCQFDDTQDFIALYTRLNKS